MNRKNDARVSGLWFSVAMAISPTPGCWDPPACVMSDPLPAATPSQLRFAALGDTGTGEDDQYRVGRALADKCQRDGCDFVLLLGDNFYPSGLSDSDTALEWKKKFDDPYQAVDAPFYVVMGNHDYGGNPLDIGRALRQIDHSAQDGRWRMPSTCYAARSDLLTLVALDTTLVTADVADAVYHQGTFAETVLQQSTTPWNVVIGHHTLRSNGSHGDAGTYGGVHWPPAMSGKYVRELFDRYLCGRAQVYFSGHDHTRQVLEGTAECPLLSVVSGAGARLNPLESTRPALFAQATLGFAYVTLTASALRLEMVNAEGVTDFVTTLPSAAAR